MLEDRVYDIDEKRIDLYDKTTIELRLINTRSYIGVDGEDKDKKIYTLYCDKKGWYYTIGYDYKNRKLITDIVGRNDFTLFGYTYKKVAEKVKEVIEKKGKLTSAPIVINTIREWPEGGG